MLAVSSQFIRLIGFRPACLLSFGILSSSPDHPSLASPGSHLQPICPSLFRSPHFHLADCLVCYCSCATCCNPVCLSTRQRVSARPSFWIWTVDLLVLTLSLNSCTCISVSEWCFCVQVPVILPCLFTKVCDLQKYGKCRLHNILSTRLRNPHQRVS